MFPQILALTITGSEEGGKVEIGSWPFIIGALPFIVGIVAILAVFWYVFNKRRFEHLQIMAAIEKGTPLSELRPFEKKESSWIKSLGTGITFLIMSLGFISVAVYSMITKIPDEEVSFGLFIASTVFFGIGVAGIVSGILKAKAEKKLSLENSALNANQGQ